MFRIGDRVWSMNYGWGTVVSVQNRDYRDIGMRIIVKEYSYPVCVLFDDIDEYVSFTKEGLENHGTDKRALFFEEITIPETALERKKWRAEWGENYYTINGVGDCICAPDYRATFVERKFSCGNYFKTERDAKESKFYKVFHE